MKTTLALIIMAQFISGDQLSEPINLENPEQTELNIFDLESTKHVVVADGRGYFPILNPIDGELFAIYRGGAGHLGKPGYLEFAISVEQGTQWLVPEYDEDGKIIKPSSNIVIDGPDDDRNPAVALSQTGRIICAYHDQASYTDEGNYDPSLKQATTKVVYSDDSGESWSDPILIDLPGLESCSPYGRIVQLQDGTLIMNIYGPYTDQVKNQNNANPDARDHAYLVRSIDDGKTWIDPVLIASAHNETSILSITDETLIAVARTEQVGRLNIMRSQDGGDTWSPPLRVTNAGQHPAGVIQLSNDWLLLFYGDRSQDNKVIKGLISKDHGKTWEVTNECIFSRPVQGDFGYPSAVRMDKGQIAVMYYWGGNAQNGYDGTQARLFLNLFDEAEWIERYQEMF